MYELSTELRELADKVIAKFPELKHIASSNVRIAYLYADREKTSNGKMVFADTTLLSDKVRAIGAYDFLVTFYRPSCAALEPAKMEILMRHELKHIGTADGKLKIVPHDVEDFADIITDYGMRWV